MRRAKVGIGGNHPIDAAGYGALTVVFASKGIYGRLDAACVADIESILFSLMAAQMQGVGFAPGEEGLCISLLAGTLRFRRHGASRALDSLPG